MKKIIYLLLSFLISISTWAAPGDDCSTAILVSANGCSVFGAFNNTGIVGTLSPPVCFGAGNNNGMWFKFIASGPVVNVTVNGVTLASPMVGLFSSTGACVSPFTELGCSNPGGATATVPYSALIAGNTYYIYVDGANNNVGSFQLCLTSPAQPSNDNPCNAITLPTSNFCSGSNAYTTVGATGENLTSTFIPPCFDNPGTWNSVYFSFTAVGTTAVISINGSIVRPQVALIELTGACSGTGYNNFGCSQAGSGTTTTLTVANVVPGTTYLIVVDGFSTNTGAFEICLNNFNPTGTVINDNCSTATVLCPNNRYFSTTSGATPAGDIAVSQWNCNGVVDNTVWFTFTTTNPVQPIVFNLNASCSADAFQFEVFRKTGFGPACGSTTGWTSIGCNNTISPSGSAMLTIATASLLPSTQYYIVADNWPGSSCNFDFTITGNQGTNAGIDQTVCLNSAAFTLPGFSPAGGSWSGPGVTTAGVFNPATAGIGSHLLYYTQGVCTDSKIVKVTGPTVNVSNNVSICPTTCTTLLGDATQPQIITTTPSFSAAPNAVIAAAGTPTVTSTINVSGLSVASLSSICLNINHTWDSDLDIYLICPSGATLVLSTDNGGAGDNYSNTCFNTTSGTNITSGAAPFNLGAGFAPEGGSLTTMNNCTMNGAWILKVVDDATGEGGTFVNWTLNFTNNVTNTIPATSFVWSPTTAMTGGSTLSPTVCPTSTTVYSLTGTDVNGCVATDAMTVTVTPLTITVTPNQNICSGLSTTLTATGATTYSWSPATGLSSTTGASVLASPTVTTTYTVTGTQGICTNTNVVTVTVASLTLSTTSPTYCVGSSGPLTASGASTYTWSPAAGLSSANGASVTASPTITTIYTVTGTSASGCVGTKTVVVTVNPKPSATLSFTNPTCGNNNGVVIINNTSCCAQTISGFASSLGSISGQTVTGLGAGSPIITLTNSFGCTFTVSATLTMTPGPTNIVVTPTNATCGNNNGAISFGSPTGGTATFSYAINGGAFTASSPTNSLSPGSYSISVIDANNCVFTKTTSIINIPGPTAIAGTASPASCAGPTGSYTVTGVTGGTPTYSYSIDGGAFTTTSVTAGLASGTHSVVVKDANSCVFPTTFNVGVLAGITSASVSASSANCGSSNATATVTGVTGGVATYSYSFDGGGFTTSATTASLNAGPHTVIIKDVNTCTLSVPYTVLSLGSPTVSITSFSNVTCFGLSNGSATVAIPTGGGGGPFSYTISTTPNATNGTGIFTGLPVGSYNITVKDAAGCIATTSVAISEPTQVSLTASSLPVRCFGTATGTINVVGAGGTPTYSYNLNGNVTYQGSTSFVNQSAGTYLMGIKDANNCTATQTVIITQPPTLAISVSSQNANCTAANGIGSATVTGGTGTIIYSWSPTGGGSATSNSVVAGNYTITATDANGCVISSPVVVGLTPGGTAAITGSTNITCFNANNGTMTAGMTGGTAPFSYSWTPGGQTTATASNLAPGTYSCTIIDFYGCVANTSGTVTQPTALTAIMNSNNVKCFGTATGTVSAAGSGGAGGYSYSWPTLASTLSTVPNVAIGNYSCTITDANGCTVTASINVTQPTSITLTSSVTSANCGQANGSATINISGGTAAYTQTWSATGSTSTVQAAVVAGTYTIEVKDANNCFQTLAVTIPNTSGPMISVTGQTNVSCFNGNNGVATTTVTGGVAPYIYSWSNGQVTAVGTNLTSQIYTVSATDQAGCVASTSVNISQPTALSVTISPTNPKCFGATNGFGTAAALGGTPSYTYSWGANGNSAVSNQIGAGSYGLSVTDGNGCVVTSSMVLTNPPAMAVSITATNVTCFNACNATAVASSTNGVGVVSYVWTGGASPIPTQTATGLCAGTYNLLATDQNSCTANSSIVITQPTQVTANISSTGSVTCFGGNNGFAVVTPGGGTGSITYTWSPSGGNAATATALFAGSYTASVSDANGCTATAIATINQPPPFTTTLTTTNVKCNGACDGTGNIAFTGGVGIPSILWQPGLQNGNAVNNLCAGNQTVTITSNGSCTNVLTFTLTEPAPLTAVSSASNSNCGQANGRTCVVVGGGTAPYGSLWSNGATTLCNNNIVAGAYTFTVTDLNGCKVITSGLINDIAGPIVSIVSQTNISCFNGNNGAATTTVTGGVAPYTYLWSGTTYTTQNVFNFTAGLQNISVTDNAGCVGSAAVTITQPTQLVSAIGSFTNVSCFGQTNGGATMLVNGGTPNYSYLWTPSAQTSSVMVGVGANSYTCNVVDANGCTTTKQVVISQPPLLTLVTSSVTHISCFGGNNGQISVTIQGGTPAYNYTWTPAQANPGPFLSGLTAGSYTLALTDLNNCPLNANFTIIEPSQLTSSYVSSPATCGNSNGSATVTIGGGTPTYAVSWNTASTNTGTVATNMSPGSNWIATIIDSKGCSISQTVAIANPPVPVITGSVVTQPTCFGFTDGSIAINYSAGTAPYTAVWSSPISQTLTTAALTQSVSGIATGLYNVTVSDNYGCSTSMPINVTSPPPLILMQSPNTAICFGQTTQISANAIGGNPAYTFSWTPNTLSGGGPHTVNPTTNTSYIVSVVDTKGCSASPKVITVAVTPSLSITGFAVTKCDGVQTTLSPTFSSPGRGAPYDFTWSTGQTFSASATSNIVVTASMPTPNQYTVTVDDKCTIMNPAASAVFTVNVSPIPMISFTSNILVGCSPLTVTLTGTSDGTNDQFQWTEQGLTGNPQQVVTFSDSGKHTVSLTVTNVFGCSKSEIKTDYIEVYPQPIASFYADPFKASILDPNINFINTSQGATNYYWDFGDPAALNGSNTSTVVHPSHGYSYVGEYKVNLIAISKNGCRDIASQLVEIIPDFALYIPNAFTPDENGLNDIFQPLGVGIDEENYRLDIFDRWGENIFTSNNFRKGWDGSVKGGSKSAPQGVYTYKLMVRDLQGNKHPYVGHVTVIRRNNN